MRVNTKGWKIDKYLELILGIKIREDGQEFVVEASAKSSIMSNLFGRVASMRSIAGLAARVDASR